MQIVPLTHEFEEVNVVDDRIAELVDLVRAHRQQIAKLETLNDDARQEIRHLLEMRGENWTDAEGYARLVPDSTRISYEARALDDLIVREPLEYGWLRDYRKSSVVRSSVQVR